MSAVLSLLSMVAVVVFVVARRETVKDAAISTVAVTYVVRWPHSTLAWFVTGLWFGGMAALYGRRLRRRRGPSTIHVCTSQTRPASAPRGQVVVESDTNRTMEYDGTGWREVSP